MFWAVTNDLMHAQFKAVQNCFSNACKTEKRRHWDAFHKLAHEQDLWAGNRYISSPYGDGGTFHIPTLRYFDSDGLEHLASTNGKKATVLEKAFIPSSPAESSIPSDFSYPPAVFLFGPISRETILRHLKKASSYKALELEGTPDIVLSKAAPLILNHLFFDYLAIFSLKMYFPLWLYFLTCIHWKPGHSQYDVVKSCRPIALYNGLAKNISSIVAEEMTFLMEHYNLLPSNCFGGWPGQMTMDLLHLVVQHVKDSWIDMKGAFPDTLTACLLHEMCRCSIPQEYTLLIKWILTRYSTELRFNDFHCALIHQ